MQRFCPCDCFNGIRRTHQSAKPCIVCENITTNTLSTARGTLSDGSTISFNLNLCMDCLDNVRERKTVVTKWHAAQIATGKVVSPICTMNKQMFESAPVHDPIKAFKIPSSVRDDHAAAYKDIRDKKRLTITAMSREKPKFARMLRDIIIPQPPNRVETSAELIRRYKEQISIYDHLITLYKNI
jgi:hypothetical protein